MKRRLFLSLAALLGSHAALAGDDAGEALFDKHCAVCHQPGGIGSPGFAPPLAEALGQRLKVEEGRAYFPRVLRGGLSGPIESKGQRYNGAMPPFAATTLSDAEAATVLNYLLGGLNGALLPAGFQPYGADEIGTLQGKPVAAGDNRKLRERIDTLLKKGG